MRRVALRELDVALLDTLAALEGVGKEALLPAVGDPDRGAVRPDAARRAVGAVEGELALLEEVVGVDGVAGAVRVVEQP